MPNMETLEPNVGDWFVNLQSDEEFQVVDVEEDGSIEVQFVNGELAEFTSDEWNGQELSRTEPPEDWVSALEPLQEGDADHDADEYEEPPSNSPLPGFEQEDVLLREEQESRDDPTKQNG